MQHSSNEKARFLSSTKNVSQSLDRFTDGIVPFLLGAGGTEKIRYSPIYKSYQVMFSGQSPIYTGENLRQIVKAFQHRWHREREGDKVSFSTPPAL